MLLASNHRTSLATVTLGLIALAILLAAGGCTRKAPPPSEAPSPTPSTTPSDETNPPPAPTDEPTTGGDSLSRAHELVRDVELQVLGNEPFWSIGITRAGIAYRTPERPDGMRFPYSAPSVDGSVVVFAASRPDSTPASIRIVIRRQPCNDGMSDRAYPYSATVTLDGTEMRGCARYRPQPMSP